MTPTEMTAVELVAAYGAKELSPVEATEAVLARIDEVVENDWQPLQRLDLGRASFRNSVKDFYLTNPIARSSPLMGELSRMAAARKAPALAAE